MSSANQTLKVFVSSTSLDLKDYRAIARLAILDVPNWAPNMMEHWDAKASPTVKACLDELQGCDLMILIVAYRKGWTPTTAEGGDNVNSITSLEFQFACENKIPVLAFCASDQWPIGDVLKNPEELGYVQKFRDSLNTFTKPDLFDPEPANLEESKRFPAFRAKIRSALLSYRDKWVEPLASTVDFPNVSKWLREGDCIPFLGYGVYGQGPLSTCSLVKALGVEKCLESCFAGKVEYFERIEKGSRASFLKCLKGIIIDQSLEAAKAPPSVYKLLFKTKKPPLIVSATEDLLLEEQLAAAGHRLVIICHVIRSSDGSRDGKIIVFHNFGDKNPEFCLADQIFLNEEEEDAYLIYKPLGSPLLNVPANLGIDTVVMTESDHLVLLGRLENQSTQVPALINNYFRDYPVIFLGYPMDMWHYRLIGQVFKSFVKPGKNKTVRIPASKMEEKAWSNLGAELLPMEPNDFALQVLEDL